MKERVIKKLRVVASCCFVLAAQVVWADDVIQLKNGDEIKAKVISVSETELTYKRGNDSNGPLRTLSLNKVLYVKYENGEKEVFTTDNEKTVTPTSATTAIPLFSEQDEIILQEEKKYQSEMGRNNIRVRFSPGLGIGSSKGGDLYDLTWIGGQYAFDVMWLHTLSWSGNLGIGIGVTPISAASEDNRYEYSYRGYYYDVPLQLQYVGRSGVTFAYVVTPSVAIYQSIMDKATNNKVNSDDDIDFFADFRIALGLELGYYYKRFEFGLKYNFWIGNRIAGYSSTLIHEFALSVGYRFKIN